MASHVHQLAPAPALPACRHRHYDALRSFHVAIKARPDDPLAHFRMGNAFFAMKKYAECRKVRQLGAGWGRRGRDGKGSWTGAVCCRVDRLDSTLLPSLTDHVYISSLFHLPRAQAYMAALRCCKPGVDDALRPKVLVNLGITQEAEGLLMSACDYYRCAGSAGTAFVCFLE